MDSQTENPQQLEAGRLAEAFRLFSQASEDLAGAYTSLQEQVAGLTAELALANGRLKREYEEKTALNERLALLLDTLPAGVAVVGADGRVEQANPAAAAILGADIEGRDWTEFAAANLAQTATPGEWEMPRLGGRRVSITDTRLASGGGRIVLIHDVTEAHRMKTQAARNERLAAMGEMAAGLAHQLRTPLAAALLYAGALENPRLPEAERTRCGTRVVERLQHLERLIRDMLSFARGEASGGESIAVSALLAEAAQVFEPLARRREVAFVVADESRGAVVSGSRKTLAGALVNLMENALDASVPGGRIELDASGENGMVCIRVRDNGRGMDAATQARLFEPFFTTRAEGTGLGLAIARGVARAHGGGIEVDSAPGNGALFRLTLPAVGANPAGVTDQPQPMERRATCLSH
ncbi:MAG: PAS domain-containing protein [Rhodocyclaceae bacterium]|jgi:two-component system sensor histidine kinase FlrB|nr:PAS domain-containing protein [Rhodocyclaceae bacterium]MCL4682050.1 PAS domain-containing protein [Rhodocyclaceae bacterium]